MAKKTATVLTDLTTAQLKRLLAARERIDVLETEKARVLKELAGIEKELARLLSGAPAAASSGGARKKAVKKKVARKKAAKKKVAKKKAGKKKVGAGKAPAKKVGRKKVTRKKAVGRKAVGKKAPAGGRVPLEDVIVTLLGKLGGQASFKELLAAIVDGKLYKSKAARFDNVLRRTLSTSKKVKRVGRGVYDVA
jgi:hypothetical protein